MTSPTPQDVDRDLLEVTGVPTDGPVLHLPTYFWVITVLIFGLAGLYFPVMFVMYAIVGLVVFGVIQRTKGMRERLAHLKAFAAEHNYTYVGNFLQSGLSGVIFSALNNKPGLVSYLIEVTVAKEPARIFTYIDYVRTDAESREARTFTVLEVDHVHTDEPLLVASNRGRKFVHTYATDLVPVELEGDFNDSFTPFALSDKSRIAHLILEPDIMAELVKSYQDLSFELTTSKLFVYYEDIDRPYTAETAQLLMAGAETFIKLAKL